MSYAYAALSLTFHQRRRSELSAGTKKVFQAEVDDFYAIKLAVCVIAIQFANTVVSESHPTAADQHPSLNLGIMAANAILCAGLGQATALTGKALKQQKHTAVKSAVGRQV